MSLSLSSYTNLAAPPEIVLTKVERGNASQMQSLCMLLRHVQSHGIPQQIKSRRGIATATAITVTGASLCFARIDNSTRYVSPSRITRVGHETALTCTHFLYLRLSCLASLLVPTFGIARFHAVRGFSSLQPPRFV